MVRINGSLLRQPVGLLWRLRSLLKLLRSSAVSAPAADLVGGLVFAVVLLVSGYLSTNGQLTADRFASFIAAMLLAQQPVRNLANLWTVVTSGLPAAKRVYEIIDTKPAIMLIIDPGTKNGEILRRPPCTYARCVSSIIGNPPMPEPMQTPMRSWSPP